MKFEGFRIHAEPFITEAHCRKCRNELVEVSNGWFSRAMFCTNCESVYVLKLIRVPDKKVTKEFLEQAHREAGRKEGT